MMNICWRTMMATDLIFVIFSPHRFFSIQIKNKNAINCSNSLQKSEISPHDRICDICDKYEVWSHPLLQLLYALCALCEREMTCRWSCHSSARGFVTLGHCVRSWCVRSYCAAGLKPRSSHYVIYYRGWSDCVRSWCVRSYCELPKPKPRSSWYVRYSCVWSDCAGSKMRDYVL